MPIDSRAHCGALIGARHKTWMLEHGEWRPTAPGDRRTAGFHLSSLYSPVGWFSRADVAEMHEQARKAPDLMKGFANTVLGLPFEEEAEAPEWQRLYERRETCRMNRAGSSCPALSSPPSRARTAPRRIPTGAASVGLQPGTIQLLLPGDLRQANYSSLRAGFSGRLHWNGHYDTDARDRTRKAGQTRSRITSSSGANVCLSHDKV